MQSIVNKAFPWIWAAVWFTLPVSMKANGSSLILFGLAAIIHAFYYKPVIDRRQLTMTALFLFFFCWHAISLFLEPDTLAAWKGLERKLALAVIPVIMLLVAGTRDDLVKWAVRGFFAGLIFTGIHLLALALFKIISGSPLAAYTYHAFTGPYSMGAIYYSCYLSIALYLLAFRTQENYIEKFRLPLSLFFLALLLFCASKLFIILTIPAIIWPLVQSTIKIKGWKRFVVPLLVVVALIAGSVPFYNRVSELKNTDLGVVSMEQYQYDTPINGLTFRMILWRFAGEIMKDENAWLTGTGISSRQQVLDTYYVKYSMYTGNPDLGDTGYLGYNFHNEFLEVMVGTGIPGLLLLLSIFVFGFFIYMKKHFLPFWVYILIFIFFITESVLERQAGIVIFCLVWTLYVPAGQKVDY